MSDLASIGSSAIRAYQTALATVSSNVANSQNPGYVRRTVALAEVRPSGLVNSPKYNGVAVTSVTRQYDTYLGETVRQQNSDAATANSRSDGMQRIEQSIDLLKDGVGTSLGSFYDSAQSLAAQPNSSVLQRTFRNDLTEVTRQFRDTASAISQAGSDLRASAGAQIAAANENLSSLAVVNGKIARERDGSAAFASLLDQRDRLLNDLSSKLSIKSTFNANGTVTIEGPDSSTPLLESNQAASLSLEEGAASPTIRMTSNKGSGVIAVAGGSIAGTLLANGVADQRLAELDHMAETFTDYVNLWAASGQTSTGQAGGNLLSGSKAADMTALPALGNALPVSKGGQANGNLLALLNDRDSAGFEAQWGGIASNQATATASVEAQAAILNDLLDGTKQKLDDISGVNLDQEAADLMRYQQAYNAAAKILKVADEAISTILNIT